MSREAEIREMFMQKAAQVGPLQSMIAKVQDVDEAAKTCTLVDDEGLEFFDVQLTCVVTGNEGILFLPEPGFYAMAIRLEDTEHWMILEADRITKRRVVVGTAIYQLTADGHLIQKGSDTMLQAMVLLVDAVSQIMVLYGNNPNYLSLQQAKVKLQNILQ